MKTSEELERLRLDIRFHETLGHFEFDFRTTWGLFSPRAIDEGTRLLVEHMEVAADADCLDLGCGYGPIGLFMAKSAPNGSTLMLDKDFVAVEYANRNAQDNGLENAYAQLSNGFDHVDPTQRFDLIASNLPAKVGKELLTLYLHDARERLRPEGRLYLVTINGLRQFIKRNLEQVFGNYRKLKQGRAYTVAMARKASSRRPESAKKEGTMDQG
jgi:16S rRNA G1207 methylase RsmC